MASISVPLLSAVTDVASYHSRHGPNASCCQNAGFIHVRKSHDEHSPMHFTADDRHRHHREALFFASTEESAKRRLERTESGQSVPPELQVEVPIKPLTLWGMVAIIFFAVSGGPFGSEEAVSSVGPFWVLIGFVVLPIIWSIPEALMTAELSTMFPGNGGYVFWTTAAFGPRFGFLQGFWSWLANVTSIAVYPHLFLEYLSVEFPVMEDQVYSVLLLTCFTLSMSYVNYRGLHIIGSGGAIAIILVLFPFIILTIMGYSQVNWASLSTGTPASEISPVAFVSFLNIMFWNLNSWENCSVLSGEIANPQKTLPKAIFIALIITVLGYLIPLTIGMGVMSGVTDFSSWSAGCFQAVGYQIGGRPLALLILFAAGFGCIGQYQSILCSTAYSLQSLGEIGMLPSWTATRSQYDTPSLGIVVSTVIVLSLTTFRFVDIVQLLNCVYCLALLLEFATLIYLRRVCKGMNRPFRIPLGMCGLAVMVSPAILTVIAIIVVPPMYGNFMTSYYMIGGLFASVVVYELVEAGRRRNWFLFCAEPPRNAEEVIQCLKVF